MDNRKLRKNITRRLLGRLAEHEFGVKRKARRFLLYLGLLYIIYLFCAGDYGLMRIYRLTQEKEDLQADYQILVAEIADYHYYLRRIKTDPHFVEYIARTYYGFSRPNEVIYHLKPAL